MRRWMSATTVPDGIPVPPLAEVVARIVIQQLPDDNLRRKAGSGLPLDGALGYQCSRFPDVYCQCAHSDRCLLK